MVRNTDLEAVVQLERFIFHIVSTSHVVIYLLLILSFVKCLELFCILPGLLLIQIYS